MSIEHIACHIVTCDECRDVFDEAGDGQDIHFDTPDSAIEYITSEGWAITEAGHIQCRRCRANELCNGYGHTYGAWTPCDCKGFSPDHRINGCTLLRICMRCTYAQESTLANLPTIDEPTIPGR